MREPITTSLTRAELMARYKAGENISALLRGSHYGNSESNIEVAYDMQAGSYVSALADERMRAYKQQYAAELAAIITGLGLPSTMLEAGVGEATTLAYVLQHLPDVESFGFDISWSRVSVARDWLRSQNVLDRCSLFTGSLFQIPLPDSSIDVVYTSHSIEPNGGNEQAAVAELYRVTAKWLILLEPAFDLASTEAKDRMRTHGYCIGLAPAIASLGYDVVRHELFAHAVNPLNPTGLTIIKKTASRRNAPRLCCPVTGSELQSAAGALFSPMHLAAYPVLDGIPCLRENNSVLASALLCEGQNVHSTHKSHGTAS